MTASRLGTLLTTRTPSGGPRYSACCFRVGLIAQARRPTGIGGFSTMKGPPAASLIADMLADRTIARASFSGNLVIFRIGLPKRGAQSRGCGRSAGCPLALPRNDATTRMERRRPIARGLQSSGNPRFFRNSMDGADGQRSERGQGSHADGKSSAVLHPDFRALSRRDLAALQGRNVSGLVGGSRFRVRLWISTWGSLQGSAAPDHGRPGG